MEIKHRFVQANGLRMHIAEAGVGPLVVLALAVEFWARRRALHAASPRATLPA